jgi:hypothetical protein
MRRLSVLFVWLFAAAICAAQPIPRAEHPRPDFERAQWLNLNGAWDFRFDPDDEGLQRGWFKPGADFGRQKITVPFCWESSLSGIQDKSGQKIGWYRRDFTVPAEWRGRHAWLRFDAVDWEARVWVNGKELGIHAGGYTPFEFDLAGVAEPGQRATVVVRAYDATDPALPRGKQTPNWYTYTSGIWQTVWLEARPALYISSFSLVPRRDGDEWFLDVSATAAGGSGTARLRLSSPDAGVEAREVELKDNEARARIGHASLRVNSPRLWTPDSPHLYDLTLQLGEDAVRSYFGLRTIGRGRYGNLPHESVLLNGEPVYLCGALDQSFNPQGIYTAPSDAFLRRDMELARSMGLNFLRIHIKADEPRRLYWADRLGVMIMQDMPSTSVMSRRSREAWESTMGAVIERDRNHPAIFAWVAFNETWGLNYGKESGESGPRYPENKETQAWVEGMWKLIRQMDPARLAEDNSANQRDHVATDLNSWHFYIGDYTRARANIEEMVKNTYPGSGFNFAPGHEQGTQPLINSEYGAVGAGGGDRDVSWGFRFLTNELRRHEKIQGYIYTELTDIEWEHNGFANYDRTRKEFGYEAFVPGMTVRDLQGEDFVGYDAPPAIQAAPGAEISVPVFVSHFSKRTGKASLRWWITGYDDLGEKVETAPESRPVRWERCRVIEQEPLRLRLPGKPDSGKRPFVGAVALELLDESGKPDSGKRIAANFVNVIARSAPSPRIEVLGPRLVALRFKPEEPASVSEKDVESRAGKLSSAHTTTIEYRIPVPDSVRKAGAVKLELMAELAARAGSAKVDWPSRQKPVDYPQTEARKFPATVRLKINGQAVPDIELPDDPADSRGVLSSVAEYHHGSYGYLVRRSVAAPAGAEIRLVFEVPAEGLSIYGESLGHYTFDPTIFIHTARDLPPLK